MKHFIGFKAITSLSLMAMLGLSTLHAETKITATPTGKGTPKYVFVFVGDGMSYPQIQSAAYYSGKDAAGIVDDVKKSENPSDSPEMKALCFYNFPIAGSASTYDATSFAPDSASTVNLNHATPAATYAHQASRKSNYPISLELVESNFDYFFQYLP